MPSSLPARSGFRRPARQLAAACLALAVLVSPGAAQDAPTAPPAAAAPETPAATVPNAPSSAAPAAIPAAPAAPGGAIAPFEAPATTPPASGDAAAGDAATGPRLSAPAPDAGTVPQALSDAPATRGAGSETPASQTPASATPVSGGTGEGPAAALPHDLSPLGMFMAADIVVKAVMLGLAFASVVTWTIWLAKALELAMARRRAMRALRRLERAQGLGEITGGDRDSSWPRRGPVAALAAAAALEIARSQHLPADGIKERVQIVLQRIEARAGRSMSRGTGLLATIGSTAPFVGLFGTVWGIMNAFIGISRANTTNLAVVAPGIAEALLATAIGLVAAIPAVIIYNVFARSIAGYRAVLADASAEVLRHLSRDLDRRERFVAAERRQAAE